MGGVSNLFPNPKKHMAALSIVYRKRTALQGYARNSRTHSADQVRQVVASIQEFGWTNPVLIDESGGVIAGHGRLLAAEQLQLDEVPTITLAGLSQAQRQALVIADNKLALNAGWDNALLSTELAELADFGFDLVDLWLTDPPYNVAIGAKNEMLDRADGGNRAKSGHIQNDKMDDGSFRQFLRDAYVTANLVMRPGAVFYVWHADSEGYNFRGAARDAGWTVRQCLMWVKSQIVLGRQDYHWKHEPCLYGWKDDACTRPGCSGPVAGRCPIDPGEQHEPCLYGWKDGAAHLWMSDRKQTTILQFDKPTRNGEHPTMKPVALFEYQMCNNTKPGDKVLDSFGGSGTTLIAAEKNGRVARVMELDPKFVDVIVRRWQEFTGKQATLESDGRTYAAIAEEAGAK